MISSQPFPFQPLVQLPSWAWQQPRLETICSDSEFDKGFSGRSGSFVKFLDNFGD